MITVSPPIDLQIEERVRMHGDSASKAVEIAQTMDHWQRRWDNLVDKAGWTKQLIPNITTWEKCVHKRLEYYLTQVLTGHGTFGVYLKRIGKRATDCCDACNLPDSVIHTIIECPKWESGRDELRRICQGDNLSLEGILAAMLESKENWCTGHTYIRKTMEGKEEDRAV